MYLGHSLVICSNYPQKIVDLIVDKHHLRRYFSQVVGGDTLPVCKPDPGHLVYSVEASGRDLSGAIMICDNLIDIKAAKAASIPIIAYPKDEIMKEQMQKFHPEIFIESLQEIPDALEQLMANSMY
jgi:phosphoglycolate phosphatase